MTKIIWQKIKDLLEYPGTLGIGVTLLEIVILVVIFCFNRQETIQPNVNDPYEWVYGTWECPTPNGTIVLEIRNDGRLYNSIDEMWHNYSINDKEIVEECHGYISTYHIDKRHKRFDCGERGVWFHKVSASTQHIGSAATPIRSGNTIRFHHENDIHNYLRNHTFVNNMGDVHITESSNMELIVNGTVLTAAINIQSFSSDQAFFTAYAPIDGTTFRFIVNCEEGTLYCQNDRTRYFVK